MTYLDDLHKSMVTPQGSIEEVVRETLVEPVVQKKRIISGEHSEVYDLTTKSIQHIILKICHQTHEAFEKEAWALEQCADIPQVPKLIALTSKKIAGKKRLFLFETKLPGEQFGDKEILDEDKKKIAYQAGKILSKLHKISTKGFGGLNYKGEGKYTTFEDFMLDSFSARRENRTTELAKEQKIEEDLISRSYAVLRANRSIYQSIKKPSFVHYDFTPYNMLLRENKLTGILDFGGCISGDKVQDFVRWHYYRMDSTPLEWLQEGYEDKSLFDDQFEYKLALYSLQHAMWLIEYHIKVKHFELIEVDKKNINWALTILKP